MKSEKNEKKYMPEIPRKEINDLRNYIKAERERVTSSRKWLRMVISLILLIRA